MTATATSITKTPKAARRRGLARTPRKATGIVRIAGFGGAGRRCRPLSSLFAVSAGEVATCGVETCGVETCGVETCGVETCGVETIATDTTGFKTCGFATGDVATNGVATGGGVDTEARTTGANLTGPDTFLGASGQERVRVRDVRSGTQPSGLCDAPEEGAVVGIPRIAARRSAGGGSRRRRGIPARYGRDGGPSQCQRLSCGRGTRRHIDVDRPRDHVVRASAVCWWSRRDGDGDRARADVRTHHCP